MNLINETTAPQSDSETIVTKPAKDIHLDVMGRLMQHKMEALPQEQFWVIWFDQNHQIVGSEQLLTREIDGCITVRPRDLIKQALECYAHAALITHNHLGSELKPSQRDCFMTEAMELALEMIDVKLIDHFLVSADGVFSMDKRAVL